jgi:hypothetical protein
MPILVRLRRAPNPPNDKVLVKDKIRSDCALSFLPVSHSTWFLLRYLSCPKKIVP